MVWVIHFCSPVAELNLCLGTQKLLGAHRSAQQDRSTLTCHAYPHIRPRIQLAVGDMTTSGWKLNISLIGVDWRHISCMRMPRSLTLFDGHTAWVTCRVHQKMAIAAGEPGIPARIAVSPMIHTCRPFNWQVWKLVLDLALDAQSKCVRLSTVVPSRSCYIPPLQVGDFRSWKTDFFFHLHISPLLQCDA